MSTLPPPHLFFTHSPLLGVSSYVVHLREHMGLRTRARHGPPASAHNLF
jgi:hypothetical protein